jgi:hypothetical protein
MTELLLDAAGRRRSPATMPGFHAGRTPRNKGVRYPADPPTIRARRSTVRGDVALASGWISGRHIARGARHVVHSVIDREPPSLSRNARSEGQPMWTAPVASA